MSKRTIIIPVAVLTVAALLFFAINGRWTSWEGGRRGTKDRRRLCAGGPGSAQHAHLRHRAQNGRRDFQPVKAGQPLVELDDEDYRAELEQAKAAALEAPGGETIQEAKIDSAERPDLEYHGQGFLDGSYIRGDRGELTITTFCLMLKTLSSLSLAQKKECE